MSYDMHHVNYTVGPSVGIYAKQEKVLAVVCYSWFPGGLNKLNNIFCSIKDIVEHNLKLQWLHIN
jgi:hypothetical protein